MTVTSQTLLDRMLDPTVKLGTSTPKADPAGDYAWEIFHKAETLRPGSFQLLSTKARQLVGGADSPKVPAGKNSLVYFLLETHQADLFLVYCSSGQAALRIAPTLHMVALPETLAVQAPYGLTVLTRAHPEAATLALYILSPIGQAVLAQDGFDAPLLPTSPSSGGTTQ
jgi:ABC-type molybdate transport system substrate-binding protein